MANRVDLKDLFVHLQEQMAKKLGTLRKCVPHQGSKGEAAEECWRAMLCEYLPKRYNVKKAFVVDSEGDCSDQIDIVIFDQQYSPFLFNQDGIYYVPVESVYAVIEAKQEIDKGMIEYAADKAASVRKLKRTNAVFSTHIGPGQKHAMYDIQAGIVALTSSWKPPFGQPFADVVKDTAKTVDRRINFGCAIEVGSFNVAYDAAKAHLPIIEKSASDVALVTFFLQLVARMQRMGTAPAIDIPVYLKALGPGAAPPVTPSAPAPMPAQP